MNHTNEMVKPAKVQKKIIYSEIRIPGDQLIWLK